MSDATDGKVVVATATEISIHAPRERCDAENRKDDVVTFISIHAPRERCDVSTISKGRLIILFQSTHRVSDATSAGLSKIS